MQLVDLLTQHQAAIERLVGGRSDAQMLTASSGMSVKDHLAHLTAWSGRALAALEGRTAQSGLGLDESAPAPDTPANYDAVNALLDQRWRDASLAEVRATWQTTNRALIEAIHGKSDAAGAAASEAGIPLLDLVSNNAYEHYIEHADWIATALE